MALAIFDLDNTLIDRAGAFRRWAEGFAAGCELGAGEVDWLERADGDGYTPRERLVAAILERYGVRVPVERLRAELVECVEVDPVVPRRLDELRAAGWKVAVATNGATAQQWAKLRRTGLDAHVDAVAVSEEVGAGKPDLRMFVAAAERCGERLTAETWMTGDCPVRDARRRALGGVAHRLAAPRSAVGARRAGAGRGRRGHRRRVRLAVPPCRWGVDAMNAEARNEESPLEMCVEALATARVRGLSAEAPIHALMATLGAQYGEHVGGDGMYRDFGTVECHYERLGPDEPWLGRFLVVRADRLVEKVRLDELHEELRRVGQSLVPLPVGRHGVPDTTLRSPVSGATVTAEGGLAVAIAAPVWPTPELRALPEAQWRAVCASLQDLLPLTRTERGSGSPPGCRTAPRPPSGGSRCCIRCRPCGSGSRCGRRSGRGWRSGCWTGRPTPPCGRARSGSGAGCGSCAA
ncbi:HAD family hydrolase [Dactylosporangium darangshiense]|uniref:HAD family hydrolase n=1 Tax=Dactylosporangium darangshiense TaxID=579108 RepID=UPI00363CA084